MDPLLMILKRLVDEGTDLVVVGGFAVMSYGAGTITQDVDVVAPLVEPNLTRIIAALRGLDPRFRMHPRRPPLPDDAARLVGYRNLCLATDWGAIDIMGELPGVGTFADLAGRTVHRDFGPFIARVVNLDTLIEAKRFAGRDKDKIAVRALEVLKKYQEQNPDLFEGE